MKKITFVLAAALVSLSAAAHTLNNPVGADGRYIVKYDCAKGEFAAANDFETDETVTIAFDITGTSLVDWLKATPIVEGANRGIAVNIWTSRGDTQGDVRRVKQINGNVYGMTVNFAQVLVDAEKKADVLKTDSILYVYGQIFGFEYTEDNAGAMWYLEAGDMTAPGSDCVFATIPYTGTKTSEDFYTDDFEETMWGQSVQGYAAPCVLATAIEDVVAGNGEKAGKFIEGGQLYILHNGVKYNALGTIVK